MNILKYLKALLYIFISIIIFSFLLSTLNYFDFISSATLNVFQIISIISSMFVGGFFIGKNSSNKGYLQGLKIGGITLAILFLLNYLGFGNSLNINTILFYLIVMISSIAGSVVGINKNKQTNN